MEILNTVTLLMILKSVAAAGPSSSSSSSSSLGVVVNQLSQRLDTVEARNQALTTYIAGVHENVHTLQADYQQMTTELASLKADNNHLKQELESLKQENANLKTDLTSRLNVADKSISFHVRVKYQPFGSGAVLKAGEVLTNNGDAYDVTSGIFKAPVNGTYIFLASIAVSSYSAEKQDAAVHLYVDGHDVSRCVSSYSGHVEQGICHAVVTLHVGQIVWLKNIYTGSIYYSDVSSFSGALLHAIEL